MNRNKHSFLWSFIFGGLLLAFTLYVVLDTFVIPRAYVTSASAISGSDLTGGVNKVSGTGDQASEASTEDQAEINHIVTDVVRNPSGDGDEGASMNSQESASSISEPVITATSYSDSEKSIELNTYYENGTSIYVADVETSSVTNLLSAFAGDTYGRNITAATSEIAADNNAVLAVNGDFYGSQEKGYVIRNGVLYRDTAENGQEDLVVYSDGTWEVINETDVTAEELIENGAWQVLSFGPAIVMDSEVAVSEYDEVDKAMSSNPRTAIGMIDENHYVLVVSDGRTSESEGLSLYQLAEFMQSLGVKIAYNLDGGGSSTMYFNGEVVNNPTSSGRSIKERSVSDIIYF